MKSYMADRMGVHDGRDRLTPVVTSYLTAVLLPAQGTAIGPRSERELRTLAMAIDLILEGNIARALDVLSQRFKAVESASGEGGWSVSRHLELLPEGRVTSVSAKEREAMQRQENAEMRLRALSKASMSK